MMEKFINLKNKYEKFNFKEYKFDIVDNRQLKEFNPFYVISFSLNKKYYHNIK